MAIHRFVVLSVIATSLAHFAAGGEGIPNWPAPASWSPSRSHAVSTLSETPPRPFIGVTPCRVADTRGNGFTGAYGPPALVANATRSFAFAGQCGIPAGAEAVSFNFGALNVGGAGDLRVFPAGGGIPLVSTLNYNASTPNIANAAIVPLGSGAITVQADAVSIDLIIDVNGYYSSTFGFAANYFVIDNDSSNYSIFTRNSSTTCSQACGIYTQVLSTNSGSGATAIWGEAVGSSGSHVGVRGRTSTPDIQTYGVYGTVDSIATDSAGVHGVDGSGAPMGSSGNFSAGVRGEGHIGVLGQSNGAGVIGRAFNGSGTLLAYGYLGSAGPPAYGVYASGGFGGTGAKYFIEPHPTDASKVIRYVSLEGRESGTYFRARAKCMGGEARIGVPDDFATVTDENDLSVQATAIGKLASFAVEKLDLSEIVLACSRNVEVFVTVNGVRRAFKDHEPVGEGSEFMPASAEETMPAYLTEEAKRRLVANGTYNPDGTVNMQTAERLGWTRAWKEREDRARRTAAARGAREHP
jgi:hypothetical protein